MAAVQGSLWHVLHRLHPLHQRGRNRPEGLTDRRGWLSSLSGTALLVKPRSKHGLVLYLTWTFTASSVTYLTKTSSHATILESLVGSGENVASASPTISTSTKARARSRVGGGSLSDAGRGRAGANKVAFNFAASALDPVPRQPT
ncbi:hypothetical protein Pcinc_024836 [Petrolisthes cinctipes]|uniref:Uncharacterized protein n=1 Tax=Petrolisthes cinctipes TaxID=88211 RepID=A0AAE1F9T7_PETCI|nr:hypothetical protein Pcinc_024836 [Petrolisthes cinctipes]